MSIAPAIILKKMRFWQKKSEPHHFDIAMAMSFEHKFIHKFMFVSKGSKDTARKLRRNCIF
jgi:hypothetical protein